MPGRHVTDHQVRLFMQFRQTNPVAGAAAKAAFSTSTGHRAIRDPRLPSMRCVGYRQAWEYLDGEIDYASMREKGIFATRQLCKRQLTWLRSMPERIVIDCCADSATQQSVRAIETVVAANG